MNLGSLLRPIAAVAALAGLGAYATIMLRGPQGISALDEKHREIRALEEENANLRRDIDAKKIRIQMLEHDKSTQELELNKLGYVHENDTEFKLSGQHIRSGPPATAPSPTGH